MSERSTSELRPAPWCNDTIETMRRIERTAVEFVGAIAAVFVPVTPPRPVDAVAAVTLELVVFTRVVWKQARLV